MLPRALRCAHRVVSAGSAAHAVLRGRVGRVLRGAATGAIAQRAPLLGPKHSVRLVAVTAVGGGIAALAYRRAGG